MGGLLGAALGWVGSKFVRTVTTTDENGEESTKRQATGVGKGSIIVVGCALLYHFIVWPIINYHWPEYDFPPIDGGLLSVLTSIGM